MVQITYCDTDGTKYVREIPVGRTLMECAMNSGVPGILAECGGSAACGTCKVSVDPLWRDRLPAPSMLEESMLEAGEEGVIPNARLSCQILMSEELDGLVVHLPGRQR